MSTPVIDRVNIRFNLRESDFCPVNVVENFTLNFDVPDLFKESAFFLVLTADFKI